LETTPCDFLIRVHQKQKEKEKEKEKEKPRRRECCGKNGTRISGRKRRKKNEGSGHDLSSGHPFSPAQTLKKQSTTRTNVQRKAKPLSLSHIFFSFVLLESLFSLHAFCFACIHTHTHIY
jgi:hypothetical protein